MLTITNTENKKFHTDFTQNARIEAYIEIAKEKIAEGKSVAFAGVLSADNKYQLALAEYNVGGYTPLYAWFDTYKEANECADRANREIGQDARTAAKVVFSSMNRPTIN